MVTTKKEKITPPKFEFTKQSVNITEEEFQEVENKNSKSSYLGVGEHIVELKDAQFSVNAKTNSIFCKNDPTWFNVVITMTAGDKSVRHWLQVPTKRAQFNPDESKNSLFCFSKFRKFMSAIGVSVLCDPEVLQNICKTYFTDPSKLNGNKVKIKIAYTKPHIEFIDKDQYRIVNADGTPMEVFSDNIYITRDEAVADASINNVTIQSFPEIVSINPAELKQEAVKPTKPKSSKNKVAELPEDEGEETVILVEDDDDFDD